MADTDFDDAMRRSLVGAWHQFLGTLEPIRPAYLAGERLAGGPAQAASPSQTSEMRDAAAILLQRTAPQERAAFLLVEIFDMSLEETAEILGTSVGAAKSALHRARSGLKDVDDAPRRRPRPSPALLDGFVQRYNDRDLPGLLELMRDDAEIDSHGFHAEIGQAAFRRERGWFHHNFYNPMDDAPSNARWEIASFEGEPVVLVFGGIAGADTLTSVMRLEEKDGAVSRIIVYALCPDIVAEIGARLGLPTQTFGYRFPFDVSQWP